MCDQEHQRAKGKKRKNKREDRIIQDKIEEEEKKGNFPNKSLGKTNSFPLMIASRQETTLK